MKHLFLYLKDVFSFNHNRDCQKCGKPMAYELEFISDLPAHVWHCLNLHCSSGSIVEWIDQ